VLKRGEHGWRITEIERNDENAEVSGVVASRAKRVKAVPLVPRRSGRDQIENKLNKQV